MASVDLGCRDCAAARAWSHESATYGKGVYPAFAVENLRSTWRLRSVLGTLANGLGTVHFRSVELEWGHILNLGFFLHHGNHAPELVDEHGIALELGP